MAQCRCLTSHFPWFFWRFSSWIFLVVTEIGNLLGSSCFFWLPYLNCWTKSKNRSTQADWNPLTSPFFIIFSGQNPNFPHFLGKKPQHRTVLVRPCCAVAHGSADLELVLPMHCKAAGDDWCGSPLELWHPQTPLVSICFNSKVVYIIMHDLEGTHILESFLVAIE